MSINKVNILFVFLIGTGIVMKCSDAYMDTVNACKEEFPVTREQVMQGDTEEVKCFSECVLKKSGRMDADGNFVRAKLEEEGFKKAKTEEEKARYITGLNSCLEKTKALVKPGKCVKGFVLFKCLKVEAAKSKQ